MNLSSCTQRRRYRPICLQSELSKGFQPGKQPSPSGLTKAPALAFVDTGGWVRSLWQRSFIRAFAAAAGSCSAADLEHSGGKGLGSTALIRIAAQYSRMMAHKTDIARFIFR